MKDTGIKSDGEGFNVAYELGEIEAAKEKFKTPKRPTPPENLVNMVETAFKNLSTPPPKQHKLVRFKNLIKAEDSVESKLMQLGVVLDQWNEVVTQIELIQASEDKRSLEDSEFKENFIKSIVELQKSVNKAEDMGRLLNEDIGVPAVELQGMTLWEVIEKLIVDVASSNQSITSITSDMVRSDKFKVLQVEIQNCVQAVSKFNTWKVQQQTDVAQLKSMEGNLIKFKDHYMKFYAHVQQVISNTGLVSSSTATGTGFTFNNPSSIAGTMNQTSTNVTSRIVDVENTIKDLQTELRDLQNSIRNVGGSSDIEKINTRVKEIESRVSGDSVSINHGEFIYVSN